MLRNIGKRLVVLLLGLCCAVAFSPSAAAYQKPYLNKKTKPKAKLQVQKSGELPVRVWKRTRSFQRLERTVLAGVKLDVTQRSAVKKAFENLYRMMKENPRRASIYPQAYRAYNPEKRKQRNVDLKKAKKAGDKKLIDEIETDIARHSVGSEANLKLIPEEIIDSELAALLKANQIADYQRILDRWKALKVRGPAEGPIRMLLRAIQDPELNLETEQRQTAYRILGETRVAMRLDHAPDNIAKIAASAREEIMKVLKSEQRTHMDKILHMFAAEIKAIRNYAKAYHGSRGRAIPDHYNQPIPWED